MFRVLLLLLTLSIVSLAGAQEGGNDRVSITRAALGSHVQTDLLVPVPKTIFKSTESVHVSIMTQAYKPTQGTLGVLWTYGEGQNLQAVHDESREIIFDGSGVTVFKVSKPDGWPVGRYSAEIFLNGVSTLILTYTVR